MLDFDKEFSEFVSQSQNNSAITDIYKIIPYLTQEQVQIYLSIKYYINKYNLVNLNNILEEYFTILKENKNLSFISSYNIKNLLKAYTQEELIKGINVRAKTEKGD